MGSSGCCPFDKMEPIPLTTKILERCGFEKDEYDTWTKENESLIPDFDLEEREGIFVPYINSEYVVGVEIKYVHQLQNKYFAWYGVELEFKEPVNQ